MSDYHLVGIGGVGMSALAEAALLAGLSVSGSDRSLDSGTSGRTLDALRAMGAVLLPQDGSGITHSTSRIVISTAIEEDNPDLIAARKVGTDVLHRSEMLRLLVNNRGKRVGISGTCGKSTVTGLAGWLLTEAGMDPSVINGAPLAAWMGEESVGSARIGQGGPVIYEADESDRSHLKTSPDISVITNASADHFDLAETNRLFDQFADMANDGVMDARSDEFFDDVEFSRVGFTYSGSSFDVPMPGRHNLYNAAIAVKLCHRLGCRVECLSDLLPRFAGISRRLELLGSARGVSVYDDYAHNTEKIRAVWRTLRETHGSVTGIWRPHGYGPLRAMLDDLCGMFAGVMGEGDRLFLLPVYDAGGTADRSINSDVLAGSLSGNGVDVSYLETTEQVVEAVCATAADGSAVVTMGARDPGLPVLAASVLAKLRS